MANEDFIRAQVTMESDTLLPADRFVNTWHFRWLGTPGDSGTGQTALMAALETFYLSFDQELSQVLSGAARIDLFDLEDADPRQPIASDMWTFTPGTGVWPLESAICLSYSAAEISGIDQRRRRGRIFLGPWDGTFFAHEGGQTAVSSAARTALTNAADAMNTTLLAADWQWSIFSRAQFEDTASLASSFFSAATAWVDDAPDTQRRRGFKATTRTVVAL